MHFLLLGATGRTGKHVVEELLSQGHTSVALVRSPDRLEARDGLTVVVGSPLSETDIKTALIAAPAPLKVSAVIFTLNANRTSDSPFASPIAPPGTYFLTDAGNAICSVLREAHIRRIVILSTAGVGDSWVALPWLSKAFMRWTNVHSALEDHSRLDEALRSRWKDLDWTLVRATRLVYDKVSNSKNNNKKDVETLGSSGVGMTMTDSTSVANAARFLVKVAVEGRYIREAVVIRD